MIISCHCRCLIIALSIRCRHWRFGFVKGQVLLAWSIALYTQHLYTWPLVLKERWWEKRTGNNSLNFFQVVFIHVVVHSHWLLKAGLLGSKRKLPPPACQVQPGLSMWSAVQGACISQALCTSVIRVLCQALDPTAFLVHPVLAAIPEDSVPAHSSATNST